VALLSREAWLRGEGYLRKVVAWVSRETWLSKGEKRRGMAWLSRGAWLTRVEVYLLNVGVWRG
jgi:hypothetical protein